MDQRATFQVVTAGVGEAEVGGLVTICNNCPTLSLRTRLLTGFAVEAAEPLVGVLLVLQAQPELSEGQIFATAVAAGPLSCRRLGRAARQHQERCGHQDLQRQEEKLGVERGLRGGGVGVGVVRLLHRKPRVSNL